ncbi:putative Malectin domain-containing protein [Helianthus annuus]|nr:putative Malectin domain-containing protein [Helianthus annuus]
MLTSLFKLLQICMVDGKLHGYCSSGSRVFRDFDIKRAAGGASFSPIQRQETVQVTNNYLEIHLFWSGKGTCCVPRQGTFGPLISAISATPNFRPSVSNTPPSTKKNRTGLIVGILVPIAVVSFLSLLALYIFRQRKKKQYLSDNYEGNFFSGYFFII